jgi:23S rRNA G2445 N2-methylase RlmL
MRFLATVITGLEDVCKQEILDKFPEAQIEQVLVKRVVFSFEGDILALKSLKTADDIDILLDYSLDSPIKYSEIYKMKSTISKIRALDNTFSLTVSQKDSKYDLVELQAGLIKNIALKSQLQYSDKNHTNLDFRLFVDGDSLSLSVRIFKMPISHRSYKTDALPGSLKASIAAGMLYLVTQGQDCTGKKMVDLFCGSGTILAEATDLNLDIFGSDIDSIAVEVSKIHLTNLKIKGLKDKLNDKIRVYDAVTTKWNVGQFDFWVSNLPMDKNVKVAQVIELYKKSIEEAARILKPENKICCLVYKPELFVKLATKYFPNHEFKTIEIAYLGQNPSIVYSV